MALKRLQKEFTEIMRNPIPFGTVQQTDDPLKWRAFLKGPEGSPYEGGTFELSITFPNDYPIDAPYVRFITRIFHTNTNPDGTMCLSLFNEWRPTDNVLTLFVVLNNFLADPKITAPYPHQGEGLSAQQYYAEARRFTRVYAMKP